MRIVKYDSARSSTSGLPFSKKKATSRMGIWVQIKINPSTIAKKSARPSTARISGSSEEPFAWATNPVVPIRRNPKPQ